MRNTAANSGNGEPAAGSGPGASNHDERTADTPRDRLKGAFVSMSIFAASAVVGGVLAGVWLSYQRPSPDTGKTVARAAPDEPPAAEEAVAAPPRERVEQPSRAAEQAAEPPMPEAPALPPLSPPEGAAPDAPAANTPSPPTESSESTTVAADPPAPTPAPAPVAPPVADSARSAAEPLSSEAADALNDAGHVIARTQTRRMIATARDHAASAPATPPSAGAEVSPVTGAIKPPTPVPASPAAIAGKEDDDAPVRALSPNGKRDDGAQAGRRDTTPEPRPAPVARGDEPLAQETARELNARGLQLAARPMARPAAPMAHTPPPAADDTLKKLTDAVVEAISASRTGSSARPAQNGGKADDALRKLQATVAEAIGKSGAVNSAAPLPEKSEAGDPSGYVRKLATESVAASPETAKTTRTTGRRKGARPASRFYVRNGRRYTRVRKGDTLVAIARAAYGDASAVARILAANRGRISATTLKPGTEIHLPRAGATAGKKARPSTGKAAGKTAGTPRQTPRKPSNASTKTTAANKKAADGGNATTGLGDLLRPARPQPPEQPTPRVITNFGPRKPPEAQ